jgi:hypothetical protein
MFSERVSGMAEETTPTVAISDSNLSSVAPTINDNDVILEGRALSPTSTNTSVASSLTQPPDVPITTLPEWTPAPVPLPPHGVHLVNGEWEARPPPSLSSSSTTGIIALSADQVAKWKAIANGTPQTASSTTTTDTSNNIASSSVSSLSTTTSTSSVATTTTTATDSLSSSTPQCSKCGDALVGRARFCATCGTPVTSDTLMLVPLLPLSSSSSSSTTTTDDMKSVDEKSSSTIVTKTNFNGPLPHKRVGHTLFISPP